MTIFSFQMNPEISVIMSVYNGEGYLSESIESILNQSYSDFEFIIINDGSTDGSYELIKNFAKRDKRINIFNQNNIGLTKSLNKGLRLAEGTYIARQDVGDISLPDRLEAQKGYLDNNPNVILVGTSTDLIDENNQLIHTIHQPTNIRTIKKNLIKYNCFSHGSMMFRKEEILELGGYREEIKYAQDYDLVLRISERYDLCNIDDVLYRYRMDRKAICVEKTVTQKLIINYIKKLSKQRRKHGKDDLQLGNFVHINHIIQNTVNKKHHVDAEYYARIAHEYAAEGKQKKAINYYLNSLKNRPFHIKNVLLLCRATFRLIFVRNSKKKMKAGKAKGEKSAKG